MATATPTAAEAATPKKAAPKAKTATSQPAEKAVPKKAAKPAAKSAAKPAAKAVKAPKAPAKTVTKPEKPRKPKLVRDSFTIPKTEYTVLDDLKQRATQLGHAAKKSEVLRAGIKALAALSDTALLAALKDVPAIKTGRPSKG